MKKRKFNELSSLEDDEIIKLNVGGKQFVTYKSTLTNTEGSSYFKTMLSDHYKDNLIKLNGYIFIDKEPEYFEYILHYLRENKYPIIKDFDKIKTLNNYIDYFYLNIPKLVLFYAHITSIREIELFTNVTIENIIVMMMINFFDIKILIPNKNEVMRFCDIGTYGQITFEYKIDELGHFMDLNNIHPVKMDSDYNIYKGYMTHDKYKTLTEQMNTLNKEITKILKNSENDEKRAIKILTLLKPNKMNKKN